MVNKVEANAFKEELWNTDVKLGEPVLIATGLDEKGRKELLEKMIGLRKQKQDVGANLCKNSYTLNIKSDDKKISTEVNDKSMIKNTNILKAREGGGKSRKRETWTKKWIQ